MPGSIQLEEPIERVFYNSRHRSGPGQAGGALGRMKTVQVVTVDQLLSHVDRLWLVVSTFLFFHIFFSFGARLPRFGYIWEEPAPIDSFLSIFRITAAGAWRSWGWAWVRKV